MITIGMTLILSGTGRGGHLEGSFWSILLVLFVASLLDMGLLYLSRGIFGW